MIVLAIVVDSAAATASPADLVRWHHALGMARQCKGAAIGVAAPLLILPIGYSVACMVFTARQFTLAQQRTRRVIASLLVFGLPGTALCYSAFSVIQAERAPIAQTRVESPADACREGAAYQLERALVQGLNDPESYRRIAVAVDRAGGQSANEVTVILEYRAKNAFGAYIQRRASAVINLKSCDMVDVDLVQ